MSSGVLFVCYANLCRSPMAEGIAAMMWSRALGGGGSPLPIGSAGTHARTGYPMHPYAATVLTERGGDPAPFRSRPVTATALAEAGLVLTAGRAERAACVALMPAAIRQTFTLRQFGRLAAAAISLGPPRDAAPRHADRLEIAINAAVRARGRLQPVEPDDDDLVDPIGEPPTAFQRCAEMIAAALEPVTHLLVAAG